MNSLLEVCFQGGWPLILSDIDSSTNLLKIKLHKHL